MQRTNNQTRISFCTGLADLGIDYTPSQASFVLLSAGKTWEETHSYLFLKGGVVAGRKIPSLPRHVTISLGSRQDMDHVLSVLEDFQTFKKAQYFPETF